MKIIYNLAPLSCPVEPEDWYEFRYDVETRAGHTHPKGTFIRVLERTAECPYGEIGVEGYNWICETQFGVSVWATFEQCLSRGLFRKVESIDNANQSTSAG